MYIKKINKVKESNKMLILKNKNYIIYSIILILNIIMLYNFYSFIKLKKEVQQVTLAILEVSYQERIRKWSNFLDQHKEITVHLDNNITIISFSTENKSLIKLVLKKINNEYSGLFVNEFIDKNTNKKLLNSECFNSLNNCLLLINKKDG